ncbi:hypothetical protein NK718_10630 [Alsobacter sp. SYSU M60028]|uniref:Uncharacterized protein n=1 Tax=Alsobacter ponti TaxID=2962936 RepID=A0ABT1LBV0_9HYPH|nr:hypothetical protein [Alsobacter ponti]MCP8938972.1 hypothetical protein [Alsobacter ponti]
MKRTLLALALLAEAGSAAAQGRPDTLTMTCRDAQALVNRSGALVLGTGPFVYDRYVANQTYCSQGEMAQPDWLRTRDSSACMVGYLCKPVSRRPF